MQNPVLINRGMLPQPQAGFARYQGPMMNARMGRPMAGDPGLFDFVGKAVKGISGVVGGLGIPIVSQVAGLVNQVLPGGAPAQTMTRANVPMMNAGGGLGGAIANFQASQGVPAPGIAGFGQRLIPGGATGMQACEVGTKVNKSGYFLKSGEYVAPGTRCVRRRRMNPLNPRALSASMRRIKSAKRAAKALDKIHIGAAPRRSAPRRSSGCSSAKCSCK